MDLARPKDIKGREANPRVFVYAAGGYYYAGKDNSALRKEMRDHLDRGHNVVKMKIGGRSKTSAAESSRFSKRLVPKPGSPYMRTATSTWRRVSPTRRCSATGDPLDYALRAAISEFYDAPMATGENLFSHQDARNLLRYGGMRPGRDRLQFDCAIS